MKIIIFVPLDPGMDKFRAPNSLSLSFIQQTFIELLLFSKPWRNNEVISMSRIYRCFVVNEPVGYN